MGKIMIIILLTLTTLMLCACEAGKTITSPQKDIEKIGTKVTFICNTPYIKTTSERFDKVPSCCLDQNKNNICDFDEGVYSDDVDISLLITEPEVHVDESCQLIGGSCMAQDECDGLIKIITGGFPDCKTDEVCCCKIGSIGFAQGSTD